MLFSFWRRRKSCGITRCARRPHVYRPTAPCGHLLELTAHQQEGSGPGTYTAKWRLKHKAHVPPRRAEPEGRTTAYLCWGARRSPNPGGPRSQRTILNYATASWLRWLSAIWVSFESALCSSFNVFSSTFAMLVLPSRLAHETSVP